MSEKVAAEALAEEASQKYMVKLEEKACSLRMNVYTPDKLKVLSAPSEETMNAWIAAMEASVAQHTKPEALEAKKDAAEKLKPLLMAQTFAEVDKYNILVKNMIQAGLMGDDDPRHSDDIAKAGKMKLLKVTMDEQVWQKYYFVMVDHYLYYYKSRKKHKKDDSDDDDDDEDQDDMPWKGCLNLTYATVGAAPSSVSSKPKVFQVKTPLRTFILKARHEVDAEEWMGHICAAQQGIPADQRDSKLRVYDVYDDPLARKLQADSKGASLKVTELMMHPVGLRFFMQYVAASDAKLAKTLKSIKSIEKYKKKVVPEKKMKKAAKIFKKHVKNNEFVPKEVQHIIAEQVESFDFAAQEMFRPVETILHSKAEALLPAFRESETYAELIKNLGPKMITVSREKGADTNHKIEGQVMVGRHSSDDDDYICLADDHKVSREHCRIDAGALAVLVTDLGSSKGTRLDGKDGKKLMAKVILPGQSLYIGGYVLTYQLGEVASKKKGFMSRMLGKK